MSGDHDHGPGAQAHGGEARAVPAVVDPSIADRDLTPGELSRRDFLRRAGLFGAGAAVFGVAGPTWPGGARRAGAATNDASYLWLAGDGGYRDPVDTGVPVNGRGDFWPGYYSRTAVGATARAYVAVMDAIRAGRMYVMHGDLIGGIDVRVVANSGPGVTLGGRAVVTSGTDVTLEIAIQTRGPSTNGTKFALRAIPLVGGGGRRMPARRVSGRLKV